MNNLNSILIEGNLVRDAKLSTTPKGTPVCNLIIASNRFYKTDAGFENEVSFLKVETWGRLAEVVSVKGNKGRGLRVVGRVKQNRWIDKDGNPRSEVFIVAEHVEFRPELKKSSPESREGKKLVEELQDDLFVKDMADTINDNQVVNEEFEVSF